MLASNIKLNSEQINKLKKIKHESKSEVIRDRAHAILLRNDNYTVDNIAKALFRSPNFVKEAIKRFNKNKLDKTELKGNNHKLSDENKSEILAMIKEKCPKDLKDFKFATQFWSTDILKQIIKKKYGFEYKNIQSYHNLFKQAGFSFKKPKTKDFRQDPEKIKKFKGALKKSLETTKIRFSW
jgi:transposase